MNDELLDLVDEKDEIIGTVWKNQAHQNPKLIHREVAIAVYNDQNKVLLQQRSMNKSNNPGAWKMAAAGHVGSGETPLDAINREVKEELGLTLNPVYYKKVFNTHEDKEARFTWVYYALVKGEPNITLDPSEVMDYAWVEIDKLNEFAMDHNYDVKGLSHLTILEIFKELSK